MISVTAFARWSFVLALLLLLSLLLVHPAQLLVTGALALMANLTGVLFSLFVSVSVLLANAFNCLADINTALVLVACIYPLWVYLTNTTTGDFDFPSAGSQQRHDTTDTTAGDIPDSEPSFKYQNWTRRTSSKGGTSPITPPITPPRTSETRTSSARVSDATGNYGNSLRGHGIGQGYGYGQRRVPPITRTSLHSGNQWTTPVRKGGSLLSSTIGTPPTRSYLALKQPCLAVHSVPVPARQDPVPIPPVLVPAQLPTPPPTPVALRAPEVKAIPPSAPKKPKRVSQKGRCAAPFRYQRPSYHLVHQLKRTSRSSCTPTPGPHLPLAVPPAQDVCSPMIVEFEDESLVLADRLEGLSITSPSLRCAEKLEAVPPLAPLVKMASPIIDRHPSAGLATFFCDFAMEIDQDSDSSDDDDSMDVDMDAWDHPPVESPLLGNSYAPSLRYQFSELSLEEMYHDHNMQVDTY